MDYDIHNDIYEWEKKHGKEIYIGEKVELPAWLKCGKKTN